MSRFKFQMKPRTEQRKALYRQIDRDFKRGKIVLGPGQSLGMFKAEVCRKLAQRVRTKAMERLGVGNG